MVVDEAEGLPTAQRYDVDALWSEMSYLAYHLHWDLDRLLDLEHPDRLRLVEQVAQLNERAWEELKNA